jgi:plasmid stabilization system protein ParE
MAYKISWSTTAQEEIRIILDYLLEEWGDKTADRFSDYLVEVASLLEEHPFVGRRHDVIKAVREFRVKPHYLIFYTVIEKQEEILILNLIDARRKR